MCALVLPAGLHTISWAEEWAGSMTMAGELGATTCTSRAWGKTESKEGQHAPTLGLTTQSEGLCPAKLARKLLIAKSHMDHRVTLFLPNKLPACYLTPLFFHQPT